MQKKIWIFPVYSSCKDNHYSLVVYSLLCFFPSIVVVVQLLRRVWLFATPWTVACQAPLSFTISRSLLKLMSIESVILTNHLILPLIFLSIKVFSNEWALRIRWPKYWSFSFSISPSSENPGLISFRIDWFDLLALQGTLMRVQDSWRARRS